VVIAWGAMSGFSWGRLAGWAAVGFAFGVPGVIAFRFAGDWPLRVRCPSCGKQRALRADRCAACGAGWPAVEMDGSEVIDDGAVGRAG